MDSGVEGRFPQDFYECESLVDLILDASEYQHLSTHSNSLQSDPWLLIISWLRGRIELYDPQAVYELDWQDVQEAMPGWQQQLTELYVTLLRLSSGADWESEAERSSARQELLQKFLVVKSYVDDGRTYETHKKTQGARRVKAEAVRAWQTSAMEERQRLRDAGKYESDMASIIGRSLGKDPSTIRKFFKNID